MDFYGRWIELDALRAWKLAHEIQQGHFALQFLACSFR